MSEALMNGFHIYHGFLSGYINMTKHREYINTINVFPVADGDTGNNMVRTVSEILKGLQSSRSAGKLLENIADLSLEGAQGNSGIILSQYLNGLARKIGTQRAFTVIEFGEAVRDSVSDAYEAMESPVEGTILTVIRSWADMVYKESLGKIPLKDVLSRGFDEAKKTLQKTTGQLKVLKDNKVVDAGAWGFVSFLEGIEKMHRDGPVPLSYRKNFFSSETEQITTHKEVSHRGHQDLHYRYCTEVLIENISVSPEKIKNKLKKSGDSLIVSRGRNRLRIHIHSNDPALVVKKMRNYGQVIQQKADDMVRQEQVVNRRKGKIAVLTDSIADISGEVLDKYQIHVLNLKITWDDEEFLDRLTLTPEEFYKMQQIKSSFPGSTIPARGRVDAILQYLMEHYEGVIVLPVAKALSGTWQQMSNAAQKYNGDNVRVEVIDTCLNSAAQGLLVTEVAKSAIEGKSLSELKELAESLKKRTKIFVNVRTFKHMVKGGRVSPLKGFAAALLNIKPIVSLDEAGRGIAFDKAFSRKGLMKKVADLIKVTDENKGIERYVVVHAADPEGAEFFASIVEKQTGKAPDYITSISPIVGMHSGKGAIAIGLIEGEV